MVGDSDPTARYRLSSLLGKRSLLKLAVIGTAIAGVAGSFALAGGWLSPDRLTQTRIIDRFEQVNGLQPGFRRNHAKGVCIAGSFDSNGRGTQLSKAVVFRSGRVPVVGRFALAGGQPYIPDSAAAVRSMALSFRPAGGEEWRTGMNDIPVFVVRDAAGFYEQQLAGRPDPATGKPDPAQMETFLARHPETARALQIIRSAPAPSGFDNATYNSLDAFRFVNADGVSTPVRWSMVPAEPLGAEPPRPAAVQDRDYLFDDLIAHIRREPLQWHLVVTVGQPGDPTDDATIPWPGDREHVDVGTLTIDRAASEAAENCRDINFDPLVLPDGIAPSDDPLLSARSAAYSNSFTRRAGEEKQPSAVQAPQ
jgi:catalase